MKTYIKIIQDALREDVGKGDITTSAIVPKKIKAQAVFIAKEDGVLAGLDIAKQVFLQLDKKIKVISKKKDGDEVKKGEIFGTVFGAASTIITGERVALNFLQHLSGIATLTRKYVDRVKGSKGHRAIVLDTRKTVPGMRELEKYAVKMGGGTNHRMGLYDAILIKDNHIKVAGGIGEGIERMRREKKGSVGIEVETKNLEEVKEAIGLKVKRILLDNMDVKTMREAVKLCKAAGIETEASGGINLDNIANVAKTGVDYISVGALTHSAKALDISLKVV
ncbi:MAG: carboxylating nicotinate-nucleotide diphosphorylase [Candidatus Margulisiibacteriota bacterium]|jgi:nicotinate-nucleotide pyrophosphorylase (carboxylating)